MQPRILKEVLVPLISSFICEDVNFKTTRRKSCCASIFSVQAAQVIKGLSAWQWSQRK